MADSANASKTRILVVDDDPTHRLLVCKTMEKAGFVAEEAEDGEKGLAMIKADMPDLVVLDVMMPGIDGFEVLRQLRAEPKTMALPVIMATALDDVESIQKAFDAGATHFLTKPINTVLLTFNVKYVLRASRLEEELNEARNLAAMGRLAS